MNIVIDALYDKPEAQSDESKFVPPNQGIIKEQLSNIQDWLLLQGFMT